MVALLDIGRLDHYEGEEHRGRLATSMDHQAATTGWSSCQSRFEFAPPRHFLLPAILLLVSEKPGYGYNLVKDLQDLRFGQVERPAVYRALAQLERDELVKSWDEPAKAGQARKVYGITEDGARVLRAWMGVVKEERDCLDRVLHRYQASGTADAALAQVEGRWQAALGHAWSPVSSTCASGRRLAVSEGAGAPTSLQMPQPRSASSSSTPRTNGHGSQLPPAAAVAKISPIPAAALPGPRAGGPGAADAEKAGGPAADGAVAAAVTVEPVAGLVAAEPVAATPAAAKHPAAKHAAAMPAAAKHAAAKPAAAKHAAADPAAAKHAAADPAAAKHAAAMPAAAKHAAADPAAAKHAAAAPAAAKHAAADPAAARPAAAAEPEPRTRCRFRVVPERSVVLIEARSTVGPIRFGAMGLTGSISVDLAGGELCCDSRPAANLTIAVDELRSGNGLYDAELLRRIDARRFPKVTLELQDCVAIGTGDRFRLGADVTFHGVTRPLLGTVGVKLLSDHKMVVTGDHALDVRDFQLPSPTVLMLRIYPDVRVNLHVEAELEN